jgi:hypothetical protein
MGSRKLLIVLIFFVFSSICYANDEVQIINCVLTEDALVVEIVIKNIIIYKITDVHIDYKNISKSVLFEPEEIKYNRETNTKIVINLSMTDKFLYTNEEAELCIKISGGYIIGDIFIGNPISKIEPFYTFPSKAYERVRIIIMKQRYNYRI